MKNIVIGGVPEHFNLAWRMVIERAELVIDGVDLQWRDFPDGSGAMIKALNAGAIDVAILLTEAAVNGIAQGGQFRIVSAYVESPLIWGVHVSPSSSLLSVGELEGCRFAISRQGSGSHLMSFGLAQQQHWATDALRFVEVGTLQGAIEAFTENRADVFLWEKFMTKPIVDAGTFRRVGEFVAPWPAFVVCAKPANDSAKNVELRQLIEAVLEQAQTIAGGEQAGKRFADAYGLQESDVRDWLQTTSWAKRIRIDAAEIGKVADVLEGLGIISSQSKNDFCARI